MAVVTEVVSAFFIESPVAAIVTARDVDGETVTTAMGYQTDEEVAIFSVATPPEHRRRGYGGAISAHAARTGFENGAELAWLQTSEMGESVYRGLGFRHVVMHFMLERPRRS